MEIPRNLLRGASILLDPFPLLFGKQTPPQAVASTSPVAGLHVDSNVRTGKAIFDFGRGFFCYEMRIFNRQLRIDLHMEFDESDIPGLTGPKLMKTVDSWVHGTNKVSYSIFFMRGERGVDEILH